MPFSENRYRIALLSFVVLLVFALVAWAVLTNSVDKIPEGGILVSRQCEPALDEPDTSRWLVHPYYSVIKGSVLV